MESTLTILEQLKEDAMSGDLNKADKETLYKYSSILCLPQTAQHFNGIGQYTQICESVRINLLRLHIESLQSHITDLDSKNTTLQILVIFLTIAALIGTGVQVFYATKADARTTEFHEYKLHKLQQEPELITQNKQAQKSQPSPLKNAKTNPASKKSP